MAKRTCSFCGKSETEVTHLLAGGARKGVFICDRCVEAAVVVREDHLPPFPAGSTTVGVRELRNQVAAVVRRAAGGERLVVTVDGRPTAQLGPLSPTGAATLSDLAAAGLVEPPQLSSMPATPPAEDLAADVRLTRVLDELRGR